MADDETAKMSDRELRNAANRYRTIASQADRDKAQRAAAEANLKRVEAEQSRRKS